MRQDVVIRGKDRHKTPKRLPLVSWKGQNLSCLIMFDVRE